MTLTGKNGQSLTVFAPGNLIDATNGEIRETKPGDIAVLMAALSPGGTGGVNPSPTPPPPGNGIKAATLSNIAAEIINEATATQIQDAINKQIANLSITPTEPTDTNSLGEPTTTPTEPTTTATDGNSPLPPGGGDTPGDTNPPSLPEQTGGTPGANAAGFETQSRGSGSQFAGTLQGISLVGNKLTFGLASHEGDVVGINFTDGQAGIESITISQDSQPANINSAEASLTAKADLLCTSCEFLSWGKWDAHVNYSLGSSESSSNVFATGWWIAGEVTSSQDLEILAANKATASYNGAAWATVANNLGEGGWKTYDASGDVAMNWDFAKRSGDLSISKFDAANFDGGLSFSGPMCAPGVVCGAQQLITAGGDHFGGPLSGTLPGDLGSLSGSAAGSFVNNGRIAAGGIMGNWNVNGDAYRATGIFGGMGTPHR